MPRREYTARERLGHWCIKPGFPQDPADAATRVLCQTAHGPDGPIVAYLRGGRRVRLNEDTHAAPAGDFNLDGARGDPAIDGPIVRAWLDDVRRLEAEDPDAFATLCVVVREVRAFPAPRRARLLGAAIKVDKALARSLCDKKHPAGGTPGKVPTPPARVGKEGAPGAAGVRRAKGNRPHVVKTEVQRGPARARAGEFDFRKGGPGGNQKRREKRPSSLSPRHGSALAARKPRSARDSARDSDRPRRHCEPMPGELTAAHLADPATVRRAWADALVLTRAKGVDLPHTPPAAAGAYPRLYAAVRALDRGAAQSPYGAGAPGNVHECERPALREWNQRMAEHRHRGGPGTIARLVAALHPDLADRLRREDLQHMKTNQHAAAATPQPESKFASFKGGYLALVDHIAARRGIARTEAIKVANAERPDLRAKYAGIGGAS